MAIWFYPNEYWTCHGSFRCYGCNFRHHKSVLTLNAKKSVLEIEKEPVKICLGYKQQAAMFFDACNGAMGWFDKRPVKCEEILEWCQHGDPMPFGIECKEWQRACNEISQKTVVPIKIKDYQMTGIGVNCDYRPASFPGGEDELLKFINKSFRYPDSLKGKYVEGMLEISFSIDTVGCLKEVSFGERTLHQYYREESRRVLEMMPLWTPAFCDLRKVESAKSYLFQFYNTDSTLRRVAIKILSPDD